ncbi:VanZ family protein [Sneathiella marina]|uniref:VanZ family protein n=1 Tax=Sneathiella marina TaxID=2950108 RepID=UPI003B84AE4A
MKLNYPKLFFYVWIIGIGVVTYFSLTPVNHSPDLGFLVYDKILHLSCYFILSVIACLAANSWNKRYLLSFMTLLVGIGIEFLQPLTGRSFETADMIANLFGILMAIFLVKIVLKRFPSFNSL